MIAEFISTLYAYICKEFNFNMLQGVSRRSMVVVLALAVCMLVWRQASRQSRMEESLNHTMKSFTVSNHEKQSSDKINVTALSSSAGTSMPAGKDKTTSLPSIPDTMPFSAHIKWRQEPQKTQWVAKLYNYLHTLDKSISPHVNVVFGDYDHRRLVLNWITSALTILQPPLHNVMVLSLDHLLCSFFTNKSLPLTCIAVRPESFLKLHPGSTREEEPGNKAKSNAMDKWRLGIKVRFPVLRLINYWGYDVAAYDSDAVLIHNPQTLYTERPSTDLFSGAGMFPFDVSERWGFTLCAGTLMLRASPAVGNVKNIVFLLCYISIP